ncbi:MAG: hypothetical protein ACK5K7_03900 [Bacilli bacterium]
MENKIYKKYHFESSHVPYSVRKVEVLNIKNQLRFFIDDFDNTIDLSNQYLLRKNNEMEMLFDFEKSIGYVKLLEVNSNLPFEIIEFDLKYENEILHLDFKYVLDQEVYVSLSII